MDAAQVEALEGTIRTACQGFSALHLRADRVGFFPDLRSARVVWVGVQDRTDQLPRLQQAVEAATQHFTTEHKEERFAGHVTLARIKSITRPEAEALGKAAAGMAERNFGQWAAGKVELMRSVLSPQGASYSHLAAVALIKSAVD